VANTPVAFRALPTGRRITPTKCARVFACVILSLAGALGTSGRAQRVSLLPKLHGGQTLVYHVSYHSDKHLQTKSPAVSAPSPDDAKIEVHALLRVEILDSQPVGGRFGIHARTRLEVLNSDLNFKTPGFEQPSSQVQRGEPDDKFVEFNLFADGRIQDVSGLDALLPEQQQAWQEWASRFALPAVFPGDGVKLAERVKSDEPEASPSPIAGLRWMRESTYVRNEPCGTVLITVQGELTPSTDAEPDTCAVILTTATLKQHSSPQKATPEAFKVRELRTAGVARGKNRIITYVSLKTGLVVRSTEEANQSMDVTVAKADGSNHVHYNVAAKSSSEVLLVSDTPLTHP
jgi:hypothetical protein